MTAFPRLDIAAWPLMGWESAGQSRHDWYRDPSSGEACLFKPTLIKGGLRYGEDWAEKIASEIATRLGIPCARVDLADRGGVEGCISRDVQQRGWDLSSGNDLLSGVVRGYEGRTKLRRGHSVANIKRALMDRAAPPDFELAPNFNAFDVFTSYLVLDALIANRDRHDENWSILIRPDGKTFLCATYDHASSLGFNLVDNARRQMLDDASVRRWAERGTAVKFEHLQSAAPTLVEVAREGLRLCSPSAAAHWRTAVQALTTDTVHQVSAAIEGLSEVTVTFIVELVRINRERILDGY